MQYDLFGVQGSEFWANSSGMLQITVVEMARKETIHVKGQKSLDDTSDKICLSNLKALPKVTF